MSHNCASFGVAAKGVATKGVAAKKLLCVFRFVRTTFVSLCLGLLFFSTHVATCVENAYADEVVARPNVLIIDAGLGDGDLAELHWLGENIQVADEKDGWALDTSEHPAWWTVDDTSGPAPATFFLRSSTNTPVSVDSIVWALDQVGAATGNPHTFAIGVGPSGLALRSYAEDLAPTLQSSRADLVGLAFIGVPQNGYSAIDAYPEQPLWETLATANGLSIEDLGTQSSLITSLNEAELPHAIKILSISGSVGDLGFGLTDGAGVAKDFVLNESVSNQVETAQVSATLAQQLDLTSIWNPFTSNIDYPNRSVDTQLVERLSSMASYETSSEVMTIVQDFYEAWYGAGSPVTYNASVILMDTSGSMLDDIGHDDTKLQAAKEAADQYLLTMRSFESLPQSPPMSVAIYGFDEVVTPITSGYSEKSIGEVNSADAGGETNIGQALNQALSTLQNAPVGAYKHILMLSDGESTRGMSDQQMLSGPVANATAMGVVIDVVGFGDIGESDASFLKDVASATGGKYYEANDTYNLKIDFLKSYYDSLGVNHIEESVSAATPLQAIGSVDGQTLALQIGIIGQNTAPNVELLCDDQVVDGSLYTVVQQEGLTSIQYAHPKVGDYSVRLIDSDQDTYLFAVAQQGIGDAKEVVGEETDYSLFILLGVGVVAILAIILVIVRTRMRSQSESVSVPSVQSASSSQAKTSNTPSSSSTEERS